MFLKKATHSHASHKARGHCSISMMHVMTSLIMGGRLVGIPGIVTSLWHHWDRFPSIDTFGNICHIDHNGAPRDQDIERRLTGLRSRRSGGGATQRAERSCRPTADTVPTSC